MNSKKEAFSLIEILVGILIISIVMVAGFQALSSIGIGKVKLIEKTKIERESYFLAEKFFEMIKKGGTLDYEEYWNRTSYNTSYLSGHYQNKSGFGNFGRGGTIAATNYGASSYYCISKNGSTMGTGGCLGNFNINSVGSSLHTSYSGAFQRYKQYEKQFIDYNSDGDADNGNEDKSGELYFNFKGDDDDLYLGNGPEAFSGSKVTELYLRNLKGDTRTFFRWNVGLDPNSPAGALCSGAENMTGSGCLGTIEFLKLVGKDYGYNHTLAGSPDIDGSQNDGEIDTWIIHPDFHAGTNEVIAGSDSKSYWKSIFPDSVNIMDVEFYIFPNKLSELTWKESDPKYQISPYVQIKMTISPSWKEKKKIKGKVPKNDFVSTISLTDLDFR